MFFKVNTSTQNEAKQFSNTEFFNFISNYLDTQFEHYTVNHYIVTLTRASNILILSFTHLINQYLVSYL